MQNNYINNYIQPHDNSNSIGKSVIAKVQQVYIGVLYYNYSIIQYDLTF